MTTRRRATLHDDEEDGGDDDATISGWGTSDFDATIFAHTTAAVADRRFPPKPDPAPAVASHQTINEQQQQQQHDKQKTKKTLRESDAKSPRWNNEVPRLAEDSHSRTSNSIKIPKARLVTTHITTSKTSPGHNNNHPSSIHSNRTNNHHSNNNISKTALVSREFAVSEYAVPTRLLQPKELSSNRRRHRRRSPHNLQQQQTEPTKGRFICKIVGLIDDDEEQEDANLWSLPPALRRIEAFRQHHTHPKYRENTFLLPPLLHGSNSVDSLLASFSK